MKQFVPYLDQMSFKCQCSLFCFHCSWTFVLMLKIPRWPIKATPDIPLYTKMRTGHEQDGKMGLGHVTWSVLTGSCRAHMLLTLQIMKGEGTPNKKSAILPIVTKHCSYTTVTHLRKSDICWLHHVLNLCSTKHNDHVLLQSIWLLYYIWILQHERTTVWKEHFKINK